MSGDSLLMILKSHSLPNKSTNLNSTPSLSLYTHCIALPRTTQTPTISAPFLTLSPSLLSSATISRLIVPLGVYSQARHFKLTRKIISLTNLSYYQTLIFISWILLAPLPTSSLPMAHTPLLTSHSSPCFLPCHYLGPLTQTCAAVTTTSSSLPQKKSRIARLELTGRNL